MVRCVCVREVRYNKVVYRFGMNCIVNHSKATVRLTDHLDSTLLSLSFHFHYVVLTSG